MANRKISKIICEDSRIFSYKLLEYAYSQALHVCCLNSNQYQQDPYNQYDLIIGLGAQSYLKSNVGEAFEHLQFYHDCIKDWIFGSLSYDLKNEIEALSSNHADFVDWPELCFFQAKYVFKFHGDLLIIEALADDAEKLFENINKRGFQSGVEYPIALKARMQKANYLKKVDFIRAQIKKGNVYEMNLCQEFYAEDVSIEPAQLFMHLNDATQMPFAAYLALEDHYLLCASPERFLQKQDDQLVSQPIKGTIKRGEDARDDRRLQRKLKQDIKERAENVMIVDLVRNDLTPYAITGSIEVEELFGIYPFAGLHHMISTIKAQLENPKKGIAALKNAFPMGSMTGAPKIAAMEYIEDLETSKRGVYSGCVGFFSPEGDFDFNVVIRSIAYNAKTRYLSTHVGGAITYDSVPLKEYEECLLKVEKLKNVLLNI